MKNSKTNLYYSKQYLKDTLFMINSEIEDLETWSAYNDDKYNEEIADIRKAFEKLKKKI